MSEPFRKSFERTLEQIMRERTGSRWKVEQRGGPATPAPRKLRRLAVPAEVDPALEVGAAADEHAIDGRG
jgi:hypothetical protein